MKYVGSKKKIVYSCKNNCLTGKPNYIIWKIILYCEKH